MKQPDTSAIPYLDDLELLLAIHRQRGIHAAAMRLSLDASTVRRRLRSMETMRQTSQCFALFFGD
ncbi:LysR family transcriptional regulator [Hydrogenophaga palleronii]|uniref:helix-turn-helix domain-containing protein n=1 Tax=Hydrogenophaga palleronii TaxID=65655 RepID=UPI00386029B3